MVACMPVDVEQPGAVHAVAAAVRAAALPPGPLYAGLAARLRDLALAGDLPAGTRLPAERELAAALGVSRVTVASAYRVLRDEGHATTRHGAGTVVEQRLPSAAVGWFGSRSGLVDFAHAAPPAAPQLLPAYRVALDRLPGLLDGHGYHPAGIPELRAAVAARFTARGLPTDPEQVVVTAGTGDATALVLGTLLEPGDRVLVEHPTYPGAVQLVERSGGRCVPVTVDLDAPDALATAAQLAVRQSAPRLAYLMPDFANPTGALLSASGRRRLAATLWQHGVLTVVDEVAAELWLDDDVPVPPPFAAALPDGATVTVGGMSKDVWGGLRIGWARTDAALADRLTAAYSSRQLGVGVVDQLAATVLLDQWEEVLAERRARLREQREALVAELARLLPDWHVPRPVGGLSVWCRLPAGLGSAALVAAAAPRGLVLAEGRAFGTGHAFDDHLRLPYTRPVDELRAAVGVLADVVAQVREAGGTALPARRGAVV